ncbi:methyl-accepting chemotaxis protein [Treponema sp.]|uniref:methyl-accepting chemotaxis protein n=1 Tax=Treponema sp. TaxID=166 RepID=UPI0025CC7E3D|nr:methyl-accepting chemotaxis protein [Treponema sp.]MCR5217065.1 methyl-accepting chemotaxis protein [Treponema sp.]
MRIRHQLIISHTTLTFLVVILIAAAAIITQQKTLQKEITKISELQVEKVNTQIDNFLSKPQHTIEIVTAYMESLESYNRDNIEDFLVAQATGYSEYSMLYVSSAIPTCRGGFTFTNIHWVAPSDFDETTRSWFSGAKGSMGTIVFSNPYVDEQSKGIVVTLSKAFKNKKGEFAGVVGVDLLLDEVVKMVDEVKLTKSAAAFMIDSDGIYVTNPDTNKVAQENFYSENGFSTLKNKIPDNSPYINLSNNGQYFAARKMSSLCGWTIVSYGPLSELYSTLYGSLKVIIIIAAAALFVAIIISLFISIGITHPLKHIAIALTKISGGHADLTNRLHFHLKNEIGEISNGFNSFAEQLQKIIGDLIKSQHILSDAGTNLDCSTQDTSEAIKTILNNISDVTSQIQNQGHGVEETAGAVNQIASNIQSLEKMISAQANGVSQASAAVEEMIENIASVNTSIEKMADSFNTLEEDAQKGNQKQEAVNERISQIETQSQLLQEANMAISSIAEQTNLLAMNAAIEAAHAGEAGKGFSVVADEIRKLSETSGSQSKTIGEQLLKIQESIKEVVSASMESSQAFNSVSSKIKNTDQLVRQIKAAMEEQNEGSKQIIQALHAMNDTTTEVKNSSQEMSEGNKQILGEVQKLQDSSQLINKTMSQMDSSARTITQSKDSLSLISTQIKETITEIGDQINQFTI